MIITFKILPEVEVDIFSTPSFSFKLDSLEKSDTVHLFESAIDLLSYATLNKLENKELNEEDKQIIEKAIEVGLEALE